MGMDGDGEDGGGSCCPTQDMVLCICAEDMQKLGWKMPKAGQSVKLTAKAYVQSTSLYNGEPCVTLKITDLSARLGSDMTKQLAKAAQSLYGEE